MRQPQDQRSHLLVDLKPSAASVRSEEAERTRLSDVAVRFEEVARILREMELDQLWAEATDLERRVIVEELLESVASIRITSRSR